MFNLVSLAIGVPVLLAAMIAFLPLLGWLYWFIVPIAVVGLVFGLLSRSRSGAALNFVVIAVGAFRLMLGGGFF